MRIHWSLWVLALIFVPSLFAGGRGGSGAGLIAFGIIVLLWIASNRAAKRNAATTQRQAEDSARAQHDAQLAAFLDADMTPIETPGVTLRSGERCYFMLESLQVQDVKQTARVGAYGGPSFRIARGVYWRTGAFASKAVSRTQAGITDRGTVYLTDQRVLFVGGEGVKEYRYDHIAAYETFRDGFRVDIPNRKPVFYLSKGPSLLGAAFERARAGMLVGRKSVEAMAPAPEGREGGTAAD